ncbi:unconventional myosin-Ib [Trichonephila clavipes]|uniref:Unconventional myosin-Ib n=1 Tax=Trichonephila clavipes TaxID=2585209 RepID=A0A8X6SWX4_TRICX|nr:unconventional myosin-Ib [Trichonephila clavipes]
MVLKATTNDRHHLAFCHDNFVGLYLAFVDQVVTYSVTGFIDKNNDILHRDLSQAMYRTDQPLLKTLFPEGNPKRTTLKRPTTTATQFRISLGALMKSIQGRNALYVRCIKPNELKQPMIFEMALVQHQVRYLGLMENTRMRKHGYAHRQDYESFLQRYKMLSPHTWPTWSGLPVEGVTNLLRFSPVHNSDYCFGRTKIFLKHSKTLYELEKYRQESLHDLATLIQKLFRGWVHRRLFQQMRRSQIMLATNYQAWKGSLAEVTCYIAEVLFLVWLRTLGVTIPDKFNVETYCPILDDHVFLTLWTIVAFRTTLAVLTLASYGSHSRTSSTVVYKDAPGVEENTNFSFSIPNTPLSSAYLVYTCTPHFDLFVAFISEKLLKDFLSMLHITLTLNSPLRLINVFFIGKKSEASQNAKLSVPLRAIKCLSIARLVVCEECL